jgi:hypothetical protein
MLERASSGKYFQMEGKRFFVSQLWSCQGLIALGITMLAIAFFVSEAGFTLGYEDRLWLQGIFPGSASTRYRLLPMALFQLIHALFGMRAAPLYITVFVLHLTNGCLVGYLAKILAGSSLAGLVAYAVFLVNPLTFHVLAWPSCLSYELGTLLALLMMIASLGAMEANSKKQLFWLSLSAVVCCAMIIISSHDSLMTPLLIALLGATKGRHAIKNSLPILGSSFILIMVGSIAVGQVALPGVNMWRLVSLDFFAAGLSSVLSLPAELSFAYLVSFFCNPRDFLPGYLASETLRWIITFAVIIPMLVFSRDNKRWRMCWALVGGVALAFIPQIVRVYLTPEAEHFDHSYLVWGRVYYFPFSSMAILIAFLMVPLLSRERYGITWLLISASWGMAVLYSIIFLYHPEDFAALCMVTQGEDTLAVTSTPWHPYNSNHLGWLIALIVVIVVSILNRRKHSAPPNSGAR